MFSTLALLFIVVPMLELYLLIKIGSYLGSFNTIALVIITGVIGAFLAKLEGLRLLHAIQKDLSEMKMPGDKLIDGLLILVGGVMLLTPGVLTDLLGILLIIPFTRPIFREMAKKKFTSGMKKGSVKIINMKLK